jgi:hypothetical protein
MDQRTRKNTRRGGSTTAWWACARRRRLWSGLLTVAAWGIFATLGCDDSPSSTSNQGILLVQPLSLEWAGKADGVPFPGRGVFVAQANLRVKWKFRLEVKPADPEDERFHGSPSKVVYKNEFTSQDRIQFTWSTSTINQPIGDFLFMHGDTCDASVDVLPELAEGEEAKALYRFVIGD